jgi:transposase
MRSINYYLGGDVSKGYCDFVILDNAKKIVEPNFQLDDTPSGHQGLNLVLKEFREKHPYAPIYAAVESTGGYENNWYHLLWEMREPLNLNVTRLNPLGVKRHKDAKLQRVVTDKISARNIAEYLIAYHERVIYNQKDYFSPLKRQWKFIRMIKKQHAQLMSLLESLMYVAHP